MPKVKIVKKINDKGYPTSSRHYNAAHEEADKLEKKKFPKGYEVLKKAVRKESKRHELLATNKKSGKIEVAKKYKNYSKELAFHEKQEHNNLLRMGKKKK